jgi:hypothetical protein
MYFTATPSQVEIPPHDSKNVTIFLKVPDDATPQKYVAGVIFIVMEKPAGGSVSILTSVRMDASFWVEGYHVKVLAYDAEAGLEPVKIYVYFGNYYRDGNTSARCEVTLRQIDTKKLVETFEGETKFFRHSGGTGYWLFIKDSSNYPPGDYSVKAKVYVLEGSSDIKTVEDEVTFMLGFREGELVDPGGGLTILHRVVEAGQPIRWYTSIKSKGNLPLNVTVQTNAIDQYDGKIFVKREELVIPPGEIYTFNFTAPTRSQGFPLSLNELAFILSGEKNLKINMRVAFGYDEVTLQGNVKVKAPLSIRLTLFALLATVIGGIIILLVKAARR